MHTYASSQDVRRWVRSIIVAIKSNTEYPPAISVHDAARIFQVTPATAYAWVRNGELPSIRLGGRIRIPTARLADLLGVTVEELASSGPLSKITAT